MYRIGNVCQIKGAVKNTQSIQGSFDSVKVMDLPYGFTPIANTQVLRQGSGYNKFLLEATPDGLYISRYGASNAAEATSGTWFTVTCVYLTSDSMPA